MSTTGAATALGEPRVLQSGGRSQALGNRLLVYQVGGRPALLKLYRRRRARWREPVKRLSYRFFEGRRGVTALQRCELERSNLRLWRDQGFDVPALLEHPLPPGVHPEAALWMEYCPGPLLSAVLADRERPLTDRVREVERFAAELARRQQRALELGEHRLVMNHATAKHVLLHVERQVSFDLETSYTPDRPILDVLADETAGCLRSVLRASADREALGAAFVRGHPDGAFLRRLAGHGLRGGLRARLVRAVDTRRRSDLSEAGALRWLVEHAGLST